MAKISISRDKNTILINDLSYEFVEVKDKHGVCYRCSFQYINCILIPCSVISQPERNDGKHGYFRLKQP
jgi:hypothetical protein